MTLFAYRAAIIGLWPLIRLFLVYRRWRGKEDPERYMERLGIPSVPRPSGPLIWIHAASVGESLSLLPLLKAIRDGWPALTVLVTTGTVTSARLLAERLPKEGVIHQYVPVDRLAGVKRFLDHWRPSLVLWAESEFWPNLLSEPRRRGIPMVLLNGRVSPRSFDGWQRAPKLMRDLLAGFDLALAQSDMDAERLRNLGAREILSLGNLKFAAPPLPAEPTELAILQSALADRPRWLAASTHAGEEVVAGLLHARLESSQPRLLTMIVPRHPDRGAEITAALTSSGLRTVLRSTGQPIAAETQVYVADTLGELGLFYRLTEIAFMGKSLISEAQGGGQNPLEPARLGLAVLHGPYMENFAAIARRMEATGAALRITDEDGLGAGLERLLGDAEERKRLGAAARAFAGSEDQVLPATIKALAPFLDGATSGGERHARA